MLRHIIGKEILGSLCSPKFVSSLILCTILILVSVYTGIANYRGELEEYHAALAINTQDLESRNTWRSLRHVGGTTITRPPQILSTIAVGIQNAVGRSTKIGPFDPKPKDSRYASNAVLAVFGPLDLVLIAKVVLSLFAILFTFDAIAGE